MPGLSSSVLAVSALSDIFFLLDVPMHFRTGFIDSRGNVDLTPSKAARRYLRTWFTPDVLAAAFPMDLIGLFMVISANGEMASDGRPDALQTFRSLRILRVPKFFRIIRLIVSRGGIEVDIDPAVVTLIKCVFFMLLFWHW